MYDDPPGFVLPYPPDNRSIAMKTQLESDDVQQEEIETSIGDKVIGVVGTVLVCTILTCLGVIAVGFTYEVVTYFLNNELFSGR